MSTHPEQEIRNAIDRLQSEIGTLDPESKESQSLKSVVAELERALAELDAEEAPLTERVAKLIEQFEIEHPRITGILNDLMVTLSGLGI